MKSSVQILKTLGRDSVLSAENPKKIGLEGSFATCSRILTEIVSSTTISTLNFRKHPKVVFPCGYKIYHYQSTHALTKARIILTFFLLVFKYLTVFLITIFLFTAEVNHYFIFIGHSYFFSCDGLFHVIYPFFYLVVIFFSFLESLYTKKSFFIYICYKPYSLSVQFVSLPWD